MDIYSKTNKSLCVLFDVEYVPENYDGESPNIEPITFTNSYFGIWKGQKHTEETKKVLSLLKKGVVFSEEHRKKLRDAQRRTRNFTGKKHSDEAKKRMSESAKNRTDRKKLRCSCVVCHQEISNNHIGHHYKKHQ